jgi:plasmid stabilization system protein ParE
MPDIRRARGADLRPGLRSFQVDEYAIIYRIEQNDVMILHVVRDKGDLTKLFNEWSPFYFAELDRRRLRLPIRRI